MFELSKFYEYIFFNELEPVVYIATEPRQKAIMPHIKKKQIRKTPFRAKSNN